MHRNLNYLKIFFVFLVVSLMILTHILFGGNAQAQLTGIPNSSSGETNNRLSQSTLDSFVSPKSLMASVFGEIKNNTARNTNSNNLQDAKNLVGESATIILSNQVVPPKDYIHIYDSLPYKIANGHLTAKLSCDMDSKPALRIFIGKIPVLKPSPMQVVKELSKPGYMCLYYLNIPPRLDYGTTQAKNSTNTITDIVLYNPTNVKQVLLNTSSIVVGINQIGLVDSFIPRNTTMKS